MTRADDPSNVEPGRSLHLLGELLAATTSLERLARLIVRRVRDATGARRVALLARGDTGRVGAIADAAAALDAPAAGAYVVAFPLRARAGVEAVLAVQDARAGALMDLETFVRQAADAIAAARECGGGRGDAAAAHARVAGQVVHKVNNRLGAIHIYAYLLAERLRRAEDGGGLEVATKLCSAVDRLGADVAALATPPPEPAPERTCVSLDAALAAAIAGVATELAAHDVSVVRRLGDGGNVMLHEPSMTAALAEIARAAAVPASAFVVATRRVARHVAEVEIECGADARRFAEALFEAEAAPLGRALVCDLIEKQGATLTVRGEPGGVATIRIALDGGSA
jgi:hypothetical protein